MNSVIVITGASSGVGEYLKQKYQVEGSTVVNLSIDCQVEDNFNHKVDVSSKDQVFKAMEKVYATFGKIDMLINCAGYGVFGAVEILSEQKCKQIFDVNFYGTLWCCQSALKYMQSGAKIVNISSAAAFFCLPFRTMYSASKAAVLNLSYGLRSELKDFGITVTCICPGDIKTNFSKNRDITLDTNNKYGQKIKKSAKKIADGENKRMSKEYACEKIFKICKKSKPKAMYIIGKKYKFLNFASRFISKNKLNNIIQKKY